MKHTKRFIVISLLTAVTVTSPACIWNDNHNNYLFSPIDMTEFRDRVEQITSDNWKAYLGPSPEYFYFDADEVAAAARQKGDNLMVSYVTNLKKYLDCAQQKRNESWDYPTKQQIAQRKQTLQNVRAYALGKVTTRLRSQHALLYMRCNMMLDRHSENIQFWEQTANQFIETVYKDMMQNIYAGALMKTGKDAEAARIFAEQGDWQSLMTQYYKRRSYQAIREEYLPRAAIPAEGLCEQLAGGRRRARQYSRQALRPQHLEGRSPADDDVCRTGGERGKDTYTYALAECEGVAGISVRPAEAGHKRHSRGIEDGGHRAHEGQHPRAVALHHRGTGS